MSTYVHIDSFNDSSIDIMIYCFTKTTVWGEFLKVKEDLIQLVLAQQLMSSKIFGVAEMEALRAELGADDDMTGLAVTDVDQTSEAFEKGLRMGDIITEAGQEQVSSIADLEARIEAAKEAGRRSLLLLVRRGGDPRFVALSLAE